MKQAMEIAKNALLTIIDRVPNPIKIMGLMENLSRWGDNKQTLVEAFRKHPNWDENALAIITSIDTTVVLDGGRNPIEATRPEPLIISVNPADYLTLRAPYTFSGLANGGECLHMMVDGASVVVYTVRRVPENSATLWQEKKTRMQIFFVATGGQLFVRGNIYPAASDITCDPVVKKIQEASHAFRGKMQEVLSSVFEFENLWRVPVGGHWGTFDYYRSESDELNRYGLSVSVTDAAQDAFSDGDYSGSIKVGKYISCVKCGKEFRVVRDDRILCQSCYDMENPVKPQEDNSLQKRWKRVRRGMGYQWRRV